MEIKALIENMIQEKLSLSESYEDRVSQVRKELDKEQKVTRSNIDSVIEKIAKRMRILEIKGSDKAKKDFIKDVKKDYKFEKKDRYGFTSSSKKELVSDFKKIRTSRDIKTIIRKAEDQDIMMNVNSFDYEIELLNKLAKEAREGSYIEFIAKKLEDEYHMAISNSFPDGDPFDQLYAAFKPWSINGDVEVIDIANQIAKNIGFKDHHDYLHALWLDQYNDAKSDYDSAKEFFDKDPSNKRSQGILKQAEDRLSMLKANKW